MYWPLLVSLVRLSHIADAERAFGLKVDLRREAAMDQDIIVVETSICSGTRPKQAISSVWFGRQR